MAQGAEIWDYCCDVYSNQKNIDIIIIPKIITLMSTLYSDYAAWKGIKTPCNKGLLHLEHTELELEEIKNVMQVMDAF